MLELSLSSRGAIGDGPLNEEHLHFMRRERAQVLGILRRTSKLLTLRTPLEAPVTLHSQRVHGPRSGGTTGAALELKQGLWVSVSLA